MLIKNKVKDPVMLHCAANLQQHRKKIVSIRDTKKMKNAAKQRVRSPLKEKPSVIPKSPRNHKIWPQSGKNNETQKSGLITIKLDQEYLQST